MENQKPPIVPNADTAALGPAAAINDAADLDLAGPDREREDALPEHEQDDDREAGGGVMSSGGTAVDRGTGTLEGEAQGPEADDDQDDAVDEPDELNPTTHLPG